MNHEVRRLRRERLNLLSRYDCGAMSPPVYAVVKQLETEIAHEEAKDQNALEAR